jgi:ATP-dependent Clp protease ATP-binding subunit ClpA
MNRIDKTVVFRSLRDEHLRQILEIELSAVQERITKGSGDKFVFNCTDAAKQFLLDEGIDFKYGARHLKRAIERFLVFPLSNLVATNQVGFGDLLIVDYAPEVGKLVFSKEAGGALVTENSGLIIETDLSSDLESSSNAVMLTPEMQPAPARAKERQK